MTTTIWGISRMMMMRMKSAVPAVTTMTMMTTEIEAHEVVEEAVTVTEGVVETVTEGVVETVTEDVVETVTEDVVETVAEDVVETVTEDVVETGIPVAGVIETRTPVVDAIVTRAEMMMIAAVDAAEGETETTMIEDAGAVGDGTVILAVTEIPGRTVIQIQIEIHDGDAVTIVARMTAGEAVAAVATIETVRKMKGKMKGRMIADVEGVVAVEEAEMKRAQIGKTAVAVAAAGEGKRASLRQRMMPKGMMTTRDAAGDAAGDADEAEVIVMTTAVNGAEAAVSGMTVKKSRKPQTSRRK
jgi:hypothetical protein